MGLFPVSSRHLVPTLALSVLVLAGCGAEQAAKDGKGGAGKDKAAVGPAVAVMVADITKEYKADEKAADGKYKDKIVEFEGVLFVPPDAKGDNSVMLLLRDPAATEPSPNIVRCIVSASQKDKAMALKSGQKVKAKGQCGGQVGMFVDVYSGELLEVGPPPKE